MSTTQQAVGFGSFHTEREDQKIDTLISLPDHLYTPPVLPVNIDLDQYPIPGLFRQFLSSHPQDEQSFPSPTLLKPVDIPFGHATKKTWFHLDHDCCFINHGAFGATMKPVSEAEGLWHRYMESQPLRFIDRELLPLLVYTTRRLAEFVRCDPTDIVMLPNVTNGLNTVLNSIDWTPPSSGQHLTSSSSSSTSSDPQSITSTAADTTPPPPPSIVISFDTGYGATKQMIQCVIDKHPKDTIVHEEVKVLFPVYDANEIVQLFQSSLRKHKREGTLANIKLVIVDYVQSNSALVFPVYQITELCHQHHIPILIDGAHTLGSMSIDLSALQPTFFVANAHKWLCTGKGVAVLYVDKSFHGKIKPAVVSHGYKSTTLAGKFTWIGLMDYSHYLSVNTALDAFQRIGPLNIQRYIHTTIKRVGDYLVKQWNSELLADPSLFGPMVCVRLPGKRVPKHGNEANEIQDQLFYNYNIEAPIKMLHNRLYIRISCHIYNEWSDYTTLCNRMLELRPALSPEDDAIDQKEAESAQTVCPTGGCG